MSLYIGKQLVAGSGIDSMQYRGDIDDCNNAVLSGYYTLTSSYINGPTNGGFIINSKTRLIFVIGKEDSILQLFANDYDIYKRIRSVNDNDGGSSGLVWSEWEKINDGGNSNTVGGKDLTSIMNLGYSWDDRTQITEGDLDTYVVGGRYLVLSSTIANGISHTPWTSSGYYLDVYRRTSTYVIQVAMRYGGEIKIRTIEGGSWSDWRNIADGGNADKVNTSAIDTATNYYLCAVNSNNLSPAAESLSTNAGIRINTSDAQSQILAGFGDSKEGMLALFQSNSTYWSLIRPSGTALTGNTTLRLPNKSGTLALDTAASTSANGLMSSTDKTKLNYTNVAYGTCTTAAATAAKVVTISGNSNWSLAVGSIITVKFSNTNTASNVTLNVNNTGAKSIWYNTAVYTGTNSMYTGTANRPIMYMYDGTYWVFIGHSAEYTYNLATATTSGMVSTGDQTFAGNKTIQGYVYIKNPDYTKSSTAPSTIKFRAQRFLDSANKIMGEFSNYVDTNNNTISKMLATAASSLDNTVYSQIATLINADASYICHVCTTPTVGVSSLRQMNSGTADATTTNCPNGAWYGKHS